MSIEAIRRAFKAAAGGQLHLDHAGLGYQGRHQVLTLTGWHGDGLPFAMVTAPFAGSPIERIGEVVSGIIAAHGTAPESTQEEDGMSQKGSGLARLMGGLRSLDTDADALASRLEAALGNLSAEMATTTQIVGNVESSVNDLRLVNSLYSNGATEGNESGGSSGQSKG